MSNMHSPLSYSNPSSPYAGTYPSGLPASPPATEEDMKRAYDAGGAQGQGGDKKPRINAGGGGAYGANGGQASSNAGYGQGFGGMAGGYGGIGGGYGSNQTSPFLGSQATMSGMSSFGPGSQMGSGSLGQGYGAALAAGGGAGGYGGGLSGYGAGGVPLTAPPAMANGGYGGAPQSAGGMGMMPNTAGMASPMQMQQAAAMAGMGGMGMGMQGGMGLGSPGSGGMGQTGRTVYVGNLPADASVDELLNQVRFGPIDNVKVLPEKNCAFISFLDPVTAAAFHSDALMRKIRLHDQELKIGWGKPSAVPANVVMAVQQSGATRNVYLGNLDENMTEQALRDDLSRFGPIDQVKIVRDKNIGFVHFLSIATAMKVVQTLSQEPAWAGKRVNYGKDRCAYVPKNQHQQQQHNLAAAAMAANATGYGGYPGSPTMAGFGFGMGGMGMMDPAQAGNRTVYLGNIHPETSIEEICNVIRGGILQQIRYIPDKHIAFVTFVDPNAALAFYNMASYQGIALHNRRLKVGWGKHSGPPSPGIAMVVQAGGSRNIYIGNIDDFDTYNEEKIRSDFGAYGEIELVNLLKEKNCAFCNFTNIANAIKAIEGMKNHEEYSKLKIAYGKDRCGNPPRSMNFGGNRGAGRPQQQDMGMAQMGMGGMNMMGGMMGGMGMDMSAYGMQSPSYAQTTFAGAGGMPDMSQMNMAGAAPMTANGEVKAEE